MTASLYAGRMSLCIAWNK